LARAIRATRTPLRGAHAGSCLKWRDIRDNRSLDGIRYRNLCRNESNLSEIAVIAIEKCRGACVNIEATRAPHKSELWHNRSKFVRHSVQSWAHVVRTADWHAT